MKITNEYVGIFEEFVHNVMKEQQAVGMAISLFDNEGSVFYENYFGVKEKEKKLPLDENTLFGLASITKSFTCLGIMQMQEKGLINIESPVKNYLPEFEAGCGNITVAHLMSHSAGFYPLPRILVKDTAGKLGLSENPERDFAYDEILASQGAKMVIGRLNNQKEFIGAPGRYLSYSNDSYGVLTEIIRRYGGEKSYADYILKYIAEPLEMERTWCDFIKTAEDENTSFLYKGGNNEKGSKDFYDNAFVLMGGGAMKSTVKDMRKYISMYLNRGKNYLGKKIVQAASIDEMEKIRMLYGEQSYYGYGLSTAFAGNLTLTGHGGSLTGVSSHMLWSREINKGVIVLCNTSGVNVSAVAQGAIKLAAGINPAAEKGHYIPYCWSRKTKDSLQGLYESGEGHHIEITLNKEDTFIMIDKGEEKEVIPLNELWGGVKGTIFDGRFGLIKDEDGYVKAIRYGGRIIKKSER